MPDENAFLEAALYEDGNGRMKLSADDAARWLVGHYHIITDRATEAIYYYDGSKYSDHGEQAIKEHLEQNAHKYLTRSLVAEVIEHAKRMSYDNVDFYNPGLINVDNGVWDIEQKKLLEHSPEYYFNYVIPTPYVENAECPRFLQFLEDISDGDMEMQATLLEAMAYALVPGMPIQKAIMLVGEGSNGKSTFLGVLRALLGPENVSHATIQSLNSNRFAVDWLNGKLANIAADLPSKGLYDTGIFKALTGGDPVPAERKNVQRAQALKAGCKLYFSANQIPDTPDDSDAFYRRWLIIEFKQTFSEGHDILPELTTPGELSGILNLLLQDFVPVLVKNKKFTFSTSVDESRNTYRKRSNTVKAFAEELLRYNPDATMPKSELYKSYCDYCDYFNLIKKPEVAFWRSLKQIVSYEEYRPERGMPAWIRGQEFIKMERTDNILHKEHREFSSFYPLWISKSVRIGKNPVKSVQPKNPMQSDGTPQEPTEPSGRLVSGAQNEAETGPGNAKEPVPAIAVGGPSENATEAISVQSMANTIIWLLKKSSVGVRLSNEAGEWGLLYNLFKGKETIDKAMEALLRAGDVYEPRPGIYKLNLGQSGDGQ